MFEELGAADNDDGVWQSFSTSLNSFAGQTVYLLVEAADAAGGSIVEAALDDVLIISSNTAPTATATATSIPPTATSIPPTATSIPPTATSIPSTATATPAGPIFSDNFETDLGWVIDPDGTDTATAGLWERANPEETNYSDITYQLGTTASGSYDLVTGSLAGSSVGSYDVDGGVTSVRSPAISLPASGNITLSLKYYLAHYSNSDSSDYLRIKAVGSTTTTLFEETGAGNTDAAVWADFTASLNAYAGQTIYLVVETADNGSGSLVEAAIDDVIITID